LSLNEENPSRLPTDVLTDRELEVFRMIGEGVKTQEIAERLHLSPKTVETHRDRIKKKLDLKDATDLIRRATLWVTEQY
jgi:DNA-binding NarL/FixJ family response regulator